MEIFPWEMRTNDFYLRFAMHQKNNRKRSQQTSEFFEATQRVHKNCSSNFHGMTHVLTRFKDWKRTTAKIHRSSNQRHER